MWHGTSVCLVHPSSCNDEIGVHRITQMKAADSVAVDARKVLRGEEQEMGFRLPLRANEWPNHLHVAAGRLALEGA
jgi:hypothetical protein